MPADADSLIRAAASFAPGPAWLAPGPRLHCSPDQRAAWRGAVGAFLGAHPELEQQIQAQAAPRAIRATPSGLVDARQWSSPLPAAALLAWLREDPAPLAAVRDRLQPLLALADWVPPHHAHSRPLDLTAAGVIGDLAHYLDLSRELLPPPEREAVAEAIVQRGVAPFAAMCGEKKAFWTTARHNWATVIAGQVGLGLLAAWERAPDAPAALAAVVERTAVPISTYPDDGSYEEGPGYWHYGVGEALPFCLALWLASDGALDLFALPFLRHTGDYALHVRTPDGGCFDVEDGHRRWAGGWPLAVLGRCVGRADLVAAARACAGTPAGGGAMAQALFSATPGQGPGDLAAALSGAPAMRFFPGTQNAMLRSGWGRQAFFVGAHAGSTTVNHAHLDLGTFTVVAGGERVLADAGSWPYTLDYFDRKPGGRRWDYEPNTTAGHNALLVDGAGQEAREEAECRFDLVELAPAAGTARLRVDLTRAYGTRLARYVRHFFYFAEGVLVVVDEVEAAEPRRLAWCGHPTSAPSPLGDEALGWRWTVGEAAAELRLHGLEAEAGFVLSETRRETRYLDRTGRAHAYATWGARAESLHPVRSWTLAAVLAAGPSGALPPARIGRAGPRELEVDTGTRSMRVAW